VLLAGHSLAGLACLGFVLGDSLDVQVRALGWPGGGVSETVPPQHKGLPLHRLSDSLLLETYLGWGTWPPLLSGRRGKQAFKGGLVFLPPSDARSSPAQV